MIHFALLLLFLTLTTQVGDLTVETWSMSVRNQTYKQAPGSMFSDISLTYNLYFDFQYENAAVWAAVWLQVLRFDTGP